VCVCVCVYVCVCVCVYVCRCVCVTFSWERAREPEEKRAAESPRKMIESRKIDAGDFLSHMYSMPHMNESCHILMSHVTYEWVMSHMNETCHTCALCMSRVGIFHVEMNIRFCPV